MPVAENVWKAKYSTSGSLKFLLLLLSQTQLQQRTPDNTMFRWERQQGQGISLDSEKTLQERQFQRYTTQDAELVDNPEEKERILQRISSCPDPV